MKRILTIVLTVCAMMLATDLQGQPLLKTHVETGDVEGVLDGSLAVYKAIPYAAYLAQPSTVSFSQDPRRRGVAHADDIMYINGHFLAQPDKYPHEAAVSEIMQQYWVNFIKTGNPNGKGLPYWPSFDASKPTTMQFSYGASLIMRPNSEQIDFIERAYKVRREQIESQRQQ